ncbi:amidohydrolase [Maritimibacter sp. HL-12]|uniref:amidohydrolase n=1 Tax=Maritimibacter sp. HL-12 TaxID=1162418 RepID=UPI000A0EF861|nr:amidohydrolase [Maritimibacter sp. HL-12]SMH40058.1 hippurate hydrolase [Maritimibacter sp. HL-12]
MIAAQHMPDGLLARMKTWRHHLHQRPELGNQEYETADFVAQVLSEAGLDVHRGIGGNGVVGVLRRGSGSKAIGFRAELDGLPIAEDVTHGHRSLHRGRMHACGHDGHMAMLLGGAHLLAVQDGFEGTAVFVFQPDEEQGTGARAMIADDLFGRFPVDAIFAIHNLPGLAAGHFAVRQGPIMASEDNFSLRVIGKGTHAAMPQSGIDAITTAAEIVTALQTIVSRSLDPLTPAVVSVTDFVTDGGRNILPEQVTLTGDVRSYRPEVSRIIETSMRRISESICAAHGATCIMEYSREFSATCNTRAEAIFVQKVAESVVGAGLVDGDCSPLMASDDFGLFLERRPGAYCFLGNGDSAPLHNPSYAFNDGILETGALFWANLAKAHLQ